MKINPLNFFNPSMNGAQGVNSSKQPVEAVKAVGAGSNPFAEKGQNQQQGVGLVNSDLKDMSYTLPNGKKSQCNTIGIA